MAQRERREMEATHLVQSGGGRALLKRPDGSHRRAEHERRLSCAASEERMLV